MPLRIATRKIIVLCGALALWPQTLRAENGYDLWLRYVPVSNAERLSEYRERFAELVVDTSNPTLAVAHAELVRAFSGMIDRELPLAGSPSGGGALIVGTPGTSPFIASQPWGEDLRAVGDEGYLLRTLDVRGQGPMTVVAANTPVGALYGTFHLLRLLQTQQPVSRLDISSAPRVRYRMLNHWDNLDRTVERGYAGFSLWDWHKLPDYLSPRYTDYARANASIGINATVLTNVNANAQVLTPMYLDKVAALADVFRPYGIRVFLTARFSAPIEIGGLETADPLDPAVQAWWKAKAEEIYALIPDFGGFLVKANSEGQPGPQDYGRSHAEGANMLANAVAPYGGVVIWRAFVYSNEVPTDRIRQAYDEFKPLDGEFRDNVFVQVKNGPLDFQPREPFHPLFGAMPETPLMMEFQITKEYTGQATHLVYLGALFEEVLKADTYAEGEGSTVARVIDGSLHDYPMTGMAGVANIGTDFNWCGSHFNQANWYAFGRLAWDPYASSREIAEDWVRMTFSNDPSFVAPVVQMMMESREAVVNYMTPLGLVHIMGRSHHYGPAPWVRGGRPDWTSVYYHRADTLGLGFDRTASGSNAVEQYFPEVRDRFANRETVPDEYLLWFHRVRWDERLRSGRTLWEELCYRYNLGVEQVRGMQRLWDSMQGKVDEQRFADVRAFLAIQEKEARWWRDAVLLYFQQFSRMPIPEEYERPEHTLQYYMGLEFPYAPGI
ncbi:MAG TPA: alpha-glucuronidase family glycosyl hydrolase [Longimicrobiaceae bacterium]